MNIFITGGSQGIGLEIIKNFNKKKNKILVTCRSNKSFLRLKKLKGIAKLKIVRANLESSVETMKLAKIANQYFKNSLDVLINNAGAHGEVNFIYNLNIKKWINTIHLNLISPFILAKQMSNILSNKKGVIINICGGGSLKGDQGLSAYGASKAALARLSEVMSLDFVKKNILVYAISPGIFNTGIQKNYLDFLKSNNSKFYNIFNDKLNENNSSYRKICRLFNFLIKSKPKNLSGKIISAQFDKIEFLKKCEKNNAKEIFHLRRIDNIFFKQIVKKNFK